MQYSGRLPEGIHHQRWSPEHIHVIIITITNRQNTDKQNHTMGKKEKGGTKGQTDRQTDGRTTDRYIDASSCTAGSVSNALSDSFEFIGAI